MMEIANQVAHEILDLPFDASLEVVRQRYLQLVKQYPPDREAEKFQKIHQAYLAMIDPLNMATALLTPPDAKEDLSPLVSLERQRSVRLSPSQLLGLGNRDYPTHE